MKNELPLPPPRLSHRPTYAFTLVEVLVAIGVIALLLSILLPALSSARSSARSVECLSIQREQHRALQLRANASNGYFPLAGLVDVGPTGSFPSGLAPELNDSRRTRYSYVRSGNPISPVYGEYIKPFQVVLGESMNLIPNHDTATFLSDWSNSLDAGDLTSLQCPAALDPQSVAETAAVKSSDTVEIRVWQVPYTYGINEGVFGFHHGGTYRRLRGQQVSVRSPGSVALLADASVGSSGGSLATFGPKIQASPGPVSLHDVVEQTGRASSGVSFPMQRHDGAVNVLFGDGHVSRITADRLADEGRSPVIAPQ